VDHIRYLTAALILIFPVAFVHAAPRAPQFQPDAVNDVKLAPVLARGTKGAAVLRAQILLDRARFPTGEIDGAFGTNMARAIAGFQKSQGLESSGRLDLPTWEALNREGAPALTSYLIADGDIAGPFSAIPRDMMEQSKLPALGYTSPVEALAEKFHVSPKLLQQLNPGKTLATAGEEIIVPNVLSGNVLPKASKILVSQSDAAVSVLDASDRILARFPATTGSQHDPLPLGTWKINGVARNPPFNYNPQLFWDADPKHAKAKIAPGPNNPVGVVWIDLSKPHYGIHGTPEPSRIGKTQSHGCIRLTNWDALALAQAVASGMPAILQE
jgi:lipoprotein-anchoring transpeptidase ErfK/SrfK